MNNLKIEKWLWYKETEPPFSYPFLEGSNKSLKSYELNYLERKEILEKFWIDLLKNNILSADELMSSWNWNSFLEFVSKKVWEEISHLTHFDTYNWTLTFVVYDKNNEFIENTADKYRKRIVNTLW